MVDSESVWHTTHCSLCWVNPIFAKGGKTHKATGCPTLATFNKLRKNASLTPITLTRTGPAGTMQKTPVKAEAVQKDVEKWQKEFRGMLSSHDKQLTAVEKKCGLKRKAEAGESSFTPTKKSKKEKGKGKAEGNNGQSAKASAPKPGSLLGGGKKKKGGPKQDDSSRFQVIDDRDD